MVSMRNIARRQAGRQGCREAASALHRLRIRVYSVDVVPFAEKIHQVAAGPAPGIQNSHPAADPAAQKLVEQVDVDRSEVFLKVVH